MRLHLRWRISSELCHVPDLLPPADGPDPCELAVKPRYRKQSQFCFDNNAHVSCFHPILCVSGKEQFALC